MVEFWIDVGGTFTDCVMRAADRALRSWKLLSSGVIPLRGTLSNDRRSIVLESSAIADAVADNFFTGWRVHLAADETRSDGALRVARYAADRRALELSGAVTAAGRGGVSVYLQSDEPAPVVGIRYLLGVGREARIDRVSGGRVSVKLGTTRGTNALLERTGAPTAFVTTAGFADLLEIGYQSRGRLFDLAVKKPAPLYAQAVETTERVGADATVLTPVDEHAARQALTEAREAGCEVAAVALLNSYRNPAHEQRVAVIAREIGYAHVSCSAELASVQRIVPRAATAVVDAYLTPVIRDYVAGLRASLPQARLQLMSSAGGLTAAEAFVARDSILSGPAGGVAGCAAAARAAGIDRAIGFDMGGTSTDVCRWDGAFERRFEMEIEDQASGAGTQIVAPMLAIETVAAGGGSVCDFDGVKPIVGPRSAGAQPGPACYGRDGPLCVTDCNLLLGRLPDDLFPFDLDLDAARARLDGLRARVADAGGRDYSEEELAAGYLTIANEHMSAAIRKMSVLRGYNPADYALVGFGGAGGQHVCAIAGMLGMRRVLLHPLAGLLSAYGIGMSRPSRFQAWDVGAVLNDESISRVREREARRASSRLRRQLLDEEGLSSDALLRPALSMAMRYQGQSATIEVAEPTDGDRAGAWARAFASAHEQLFGFAFAEREIEIRTARVEVAAKPVHVAPAEGAAEPSPPGAPLREARVYLDGTWRPAPVFRRDALPPGARVEGPALVLEATSTTLIEPGWRADLLGDGALLLRGERAVDAAHGEGRARPRDAAKRRTGSQTYGSVDADPDPIELELFHNRFAAIAEQMGAALERTALSTNVKERLDFSCAIFDAAGGLVANAPHIPVHLGAMGGSVRGILEALRERGDAPRRGDVFVSNDPYRGGSHLPDVTVVTPIFAEQPTTAQDTRDPGGGDRRRDATADEVLFFAASRAHHAEIGGIAPGSMPPDSRSLADEGVLIEPQRLVTFDVDRGEAVFQEDGLRALLTSGPHPSRNVGENLADLRAQAAANQRGAALLRELVAEHGQARVAAYMRHIQAAAAEKMRAALRKLPAGRREFEDGLEAPAIVALSDTSPGDGQGGGAARLPVRVAIEIGDGAATLDFAGTAGVMAGNLNATPAIVTSAVLYCFRCLLAEDIPLNGGVLAPIEIVLPEGLLNPPRGDERDAGAAPGGPRTAGVRRAAVVGGNVETSQRIVDVIFGALGVAAASQGTMNNVTFGNPRFGYYETLGGGAGAGADWCGASAVHTHMTNTRLTDVEVLEERYPVRVVRFGVRRGSGGAGQYRGGDGLVRELEFLEPVRVSLLTQRRSTQPYGAAGGGPGEAGRNVLIRADGSVEVLAALAAADLGAGDRLRIETPGGGGWGAV